MVLVIWNKAHHSSGTLVLLVTGLGDRAAEHCNGLSAASLTADGFQLDRVTLDLHQTL